MKCIQLVPVVPEAATPMRLPILKFHCGQCRDLIYVVGSFVPPTAPQEPPPEPKASLGSTILEAFLLAAAPIVGAWAATKVTRAIDRRAATRRRSRRYRH